MFVSACRNTGKVHSMMKTLRVLLAGGLAALAGCGELFLLDPADLGVTEERGVALCGGGVGGVDVELTVHDVSFGVVVLTSTIPAKGGVEDRAIAQRIGPLVGPARLRCPEISA